MMEFMRTNPHEGKYCMDMTFGRLCWKSMELANALRAEIDNGCVFIVEVS